MSTSPGSRPAAQRNISLILRRTEFRFTALPTFLETDRPNLGLSNAFGST